MSQARSKVDITVVEGKICAIGGAISVQKWSGDSSTNENLIYTPIGLSGLYFFFSFSLR